MCVLNRLSHDVYLWNLYDKVLNHLVNTLLMWSLYGLLNGLVHGDLSLRHGQTDGIGHDQVFLCDLSGFRISNTSILGGLTLCIICCTFGKVPVVVTFHLPIQHLRLIRASQLDQILVHESKDAFTDLLELIFHFRDVFSRV